MRNFIAAILMLGLLAPGWAAAQEAKTEHGVAAVYAQKLAAIAPPAARNSIATI